MDTSSDTSAPKDKAMHVDTDSGIICKSNIWCSALKMQLARFLIGGFEYCMERNRCLQPKWCKFNVAIFKRSSNRQIETTVKYITYTINLLHD